MANVIDQFVFKLGINADDVNRQASKAKKSLSDVEDQADKTGKSFANMGNDGNNAFIAVNKSAAVFFATLAGAVVLKNFIKQTADATASLGRFSSNMGMSVTDVAAWSTAAEKVGGSADSMTKAFAMLSDAQFNLQTKGNSSLIPFYSKLGIGNIGNDPSKEILKISAAIQKMQAPTQYKYNFLKQMGFDEGAVNLILQGTSAIKKSVEEARKLAPSPQEVQSAKELQANLKEIDKSFTKLANSALPVLNNIFKWFNDVNQTTDNMALKIAAAATAFKALGGSAVLSAINTLTQSLGGLGNALGKVTGGLGLLLHSDKLNQGEDAFLAKNRELAKKQGINPLGSPEAVAKGLAKNAVAPTSGKNGFSALEKQYGLPAGLLDSMWLQESGRGKNMISGAGATGHFQFMPQTAKAYGMSRADTFDLNKSSESAARMMANLLRHYKGDLNKALAGYNFGTGNVDSGKAWPTETQNYTRQIQSRIGQPVNASSVNNSKSIQNNIAEVKVYTQATDATGIARDMNKSMNYALAGQADYGVTP